jgi:hypothetical protein
MAACVANAAALLGGCRRSCDSSLEAGRPKNLIELGLRGVSDRVQVRLMKGKVSSAAGSYWPIIPKWGDRRFIREVPAWSYED